MIKNSQSIRTDAANRPVWQIMTPLTPAPDLATESMPVPTPARNSEAPRPMPLDSTSWSEP